MNSSTFVWVFGYGSLVSPESFAETIGRPPRLGADFHEAELAGFGRRWNYGVLHTAGRCAGDPAGVDRTLVALGIVESPDERVDGVVGRVDASELAALDLRERHYDRVDVTARVTTSAALPAGEQVAVYVPRREPVLHYERSRDQGRAAIERRYWDLVDGAFRAFGAEAHARYLASTPPPDVPVLDIERVFGIG